MVRMEDIMGKEVISSDAIIVGTVEGISIDPDNWRIPAIRLGVTKGLEIAVDKRKKTFGSSKIQVNTGAINSVSDTITLNVSMAELRGALVSDTCWPVNFGNLLGKRVICKKGRQIGNIDNIVFEPKENWSILYLDVKVDKATKEDLDLKKRMMKNSSQIIIRTVDIRTIGDMVMLKLDIEELKQWLEGKPATAKD